MNIQLLQPPLPFRKRDNLPVLIVLHATAGATARSSINHLRGVGLSYHYIITRDAKDSPKSIATTMEQGRPTEYYRGRIGCKTWV